MGFETQAHSTESSKVAKRRIGPAVDQGSQRDRPRVRERIGKFFGTTPTPELLAAVKGFNDGTLLGGDPKELKPDVWFHTSRNPQKERVMVTVTKNGTKFDFISRRDENGNFTVPQPLSPHLVRGELRSDTEGQRSTAQLRVVKNG